MEYFAATLAQPMLAAVDPLVGLVILIISVIASLLKKKGKGGGPLEDWTDDSEAPAPPPPRRFITPQAPPPQTPGPSARPTNWEEELRRLLEGDRPPAAPAPPPPIIIHETPRPKPPPPSVVVARPAQVTRSLAAHPVALRAEETEAHAAKLAAFKESTRAYEKASRLEASVAAHLERVTHAPVALTHILQRRGRSAEVEQIVSLFRNPGTARQAVIASVILGPARALEPAAAEF